MSEIKKEDIKQEVFDLYDDYADMIEYMMKHYYKSTARYSTSSFMRLKMQEALSKRGLAPHIFESADEAHAAVEAARLASIHAAE